MLTKKLAISLLATASLVVGTTAAQAATPPAVEWSASYDAGGYEHFHSVVQTADGGYAGVGGNYLMQTDAVGNLVWAVQNAAELMCIKKVSGGGFIVSGYLGNNAYLAKYDDAGTLLWEQQFAQARRASTVQPTKDGGYIVSGYVNNGSATGEDMWLLKVDATGNFQWEKTFGGAKADLPGEFDNALQQTSDGGYILAGTSWSYATQPYTSDVYVVKTDAYGNLKWQKTYGGTQTDMGNAVQQTTDGGYIIAGRYQTSTSNDAYLIKTDTFGNSQWQKIYGGSSYTDAAHTVFQTSDGGYLLGGYYSFDYTDFDMYLVKTTSTGAISWQNAYGGYLGEFLYTLNQTSDGGYVLGGYTESFATTGRDYFLVKLGTAGALAQSTTGDKAAPQIMVRSIQ